MFKRFSISRKTGEPLDSGIQAQIDFLGNCAANNKSRIGFYDKAKSIIATLEEGTKTPDTLDSVISVLVKMRDQKFEPTAGLFSACTTSDAKTDKDVQANLDAVIKNLQTQKTNIAQEKIGSANAGATAGAHESNKDLAMLQNNIKELDTLNKIIEKIHGDDNLQGAVKDIVNKVRPLCSQMMTQLEDKHDKIDFSSEGDMLKYVQILAEKMDKTESDSQRKKWLQDIKACNSMNDFIKLDADINRERLTHEQRDDSFKKGISKENRNTCANKIITELTKGTIIITEEGKKVGKEIKFSEELVKKIELKSVISQFHENLVNLDNKYNDNVELATILANAFCNLPVVSELKKYESPAKNDKLSLS